MGKRTILRHAMHLAIRLSVISGLSLAASQPASATNYFATFTGVYNYAVSYDPYSDPAYIYDTTPTPFTTTVRLLYPLVYVEGQPGDDYYAEYPALDYYLNDPALGTVHRFIGGRRSDGVPNPVTLTDKPGYNPITYPDPGYHSSGDWENGSATLGFRSLSFSLWTGEGSSFDIGITSLQDLFPTIEHLTDIDIDVGSGNGVTGTVTSFSNYYKEPQYSKSTGYITGLRIFTLNEVPEPDSWALMIVGFGAIGLAIRSRRRAGPALA